MKLLNVTLHCKQQRHQQSMKVNPDCIGQTATWNPARFSSSSGMSVPSDSTHFPHEQMSGPRETFRSMFVSVLSRETGAVHIMSQHKQEHVGVGGGNL